MARLIETMLTEAYGIAPVSCVPAARGFVAETFVAEDRDGARFFVKWLPSWASAPAMRRGLAVSERLRALAAAPAPAVIRTRAGKLSTELEGRAIAVFEFVEGERGAVRDQRLGPGSFNYDFETFVDLLASIHEATRAMDVELPRETFAIPWASQFEAAFRRVLRALTSTAPQAELRALLQRYQAQIEADWADLQAMAQRCRDGGWTPVLTHGDLAGDNLIIGADGQLHPIDWDDPVLAPAERDAWFFTCDPEAAAAFQQAYRRVFPDWSVDALRRRYYLFWRFFQDILGYIEIILDDRSPARQAWSLAELEKTCFEWLWPAMRSLR